MADLIVEGLEELLAGFDRFAEELKKRESTAEALVANEYKNDVQAKITEIGLYKSGNYRTSIHVEGPFTDTDGSTYYLVGTDRIDAKQHEFGGVIRAKNGPYLIFKTEDGQWHKVPFVTQPPHPHFYPALDANAEKYKQMMAEAMLQ
jgi:hypothetical protein